VIFGSGAGYKILLFLHLACVVVGFGPYFLNGLMSRTAGKASDTEARAIAGAGLQISTISQYAIYGVLIFGGAMVGAAPKNTIKFSQAWLPISIVLWIATVGVLHALILPTQRKLRDGDGDRGSLASRLSMSFGILNLLVLVTMLLMIFEPGNKLL
jgi:hypothetical protein